MKIMSKDNLSIITKIAIIACFICGICICAFWYPYSVSISVSNSAENEIAAPDSVERWTQLIFYWTVSIPCFTILILSWKLTKAMKREKVFSVDIAKLFSLLSKILLYDLIVYFIGNVVFLVLGWNDFAALYLLIAIAGTVLGIVLCICSHYTFRANFLQEEYEGTV